MSYHFAFGHPDLNEWGQMIYKSTHVLHVTDGYAVGIFLDREILKWMQDQKWCYAVDYSLTLYPKDDLDVYQKATINSISTDPPYQFRIIFPDHSNAMLFKLTWL